MSRLAYWSSLLSACFLACILASPTPSSNDIQARGPGAAKNVIVQMFGWNWDSIAAECTNFLGPAGYGFVQVGPPQEHITGNQWWIEYQPVSYQIASKKGNRAQFQNMVSTCKAAGVEIIADTIWNHMAGVSGGTGSGGSSFTQYNYPGIYQYGDFHHCGLQPGDDIKNYGNRLEVQTCELVNLADLATETEYVRNRLAQYANDLISLGVSGLRLDAAKHIAASDIANIVSRLSRKVYITQEVIYGGGEPITPSEYVGNGDVQEFRYTSAVRDAFLGGSISSLQNFDNRGWVSGNQANVFVANHDTERNGASLKYDSSSNTYTNAMVFSLAHPYGTPTILSSFSFGDQDAGAPNNGYGTCSANGGSSGWVCQHRFPAVSGMVGFRNTVGSSGLSNWSSPQGNRIAFGRGNAGFVVINNADDAWTGTFYTSVADGSYCNVINGKATSGGCTGSSVTVSGGSFSATVQGRSSLAIHVGAKGTGSGSPDPGTPGTGSVSVTFQQVATTVFGENIFLVGSISALGSWAPASAIALSPANYPTWTVTVSLPANSAIQYKFIRKGADGSVTWESDPNRQLTTGSSGSQTVSSSWK